MDEVDPYRAPTASIAPPLDALADLASRGARLGAVAIDLSCALATWIPSLLLVLVPRLMHGELDERVVWGAALISMLLSFLLVVVQAMQLHRHGGTIGKRVLRLRIVRSDGTHAAFARSFWLRLVAPGLSCAGIGMMPCCMPFTLVTLPVIVPLLALDALLIFGAARRCGHDYIADTVVVRKVREPKS